LYRKQSVAGGAIDQFSYDQMGFAPCAYQI
jgi:hypothetical protein